MDNLNLNATILNGKNVFPQSLENRFLLSFTQQTQQAKKATSWDFNQENVKSSRVSMIVITRIFSSVIMKVNKKHNL